MNSVSAFHEIIRLPLHRYLHGLHRSDARLRRNKIRKMEITMSKTIVTLLGSALVLASTLQMATAAEHHGTRKAHRAPATVSERVRQSNDYAPNPAVNPDYARYSTGGGVISAPAGR